MPKRQAAPTGEIKVHVTRPDKVIFTISVPPDMLVCNFYNWPGWLGVPSNDFGIDLNGNLFPGSFKIKAKDLCKPRASEAHIGLRYGYIVHAGIQGTGQTTYFEIFDSTTMADLKMMIIRKFDLPKRAALNSIIVNGKGVDEGFSAWKTLSVPLGKEQLTAYIGGRRN